MHPAPVFGIEEVGGTCRYVRIGDLLHTGVGKTIRKRGAAQYPPLQLPEMPDEAGLSDVVDYQSAPLKQSDSITLKPVRSRIAPGSDTRGGDTCYGRKDSPVICRAAAGCNQSVDRRRETTTQPVGP